MLILRPRAGRCGERLTTNLIPPARTSGHRKAENKMGGGRQAYATRSLNNFNFREKKIFFFLFQNYWSVEYFLFFLEIAN